MTSTLHLGDCLDVMRTLDADSVDAVVTDPPSGINFMNREWDGHKGGRAQWIAWLSERLAEAHRVAKPGARLLCWAIPRTSHWTGTAIEDAGWIIEDRLAHLFGTGMPKAQSRLKPSVEDWWLARKASKGVPPLNIDACRIEGMVPQVTQGVTRRAADGTAVYGQGHDIRRVPQLSNPHTLGRWPANLVLDEEAAAMLDAQTGTLKSGALEQSSVKAKSLGYGFDGYANPKTYEPSSGGASRFYYCPKASKSDRGEGNIHPTVKSHNLMRWLVRLIAKPGDLLLDPFAGSGSTALACQAEGVRFVGVEQSAEYHAIAEARIRAAEQAKGELLFA